MARVTVEDCVDKVFNRFELVLLATQRTRELYSGALPTVPRDNDKNPVIALREIADETVPVPELRSRFLKFLRQNTFGFSSELSHDDELEQAISNEATSRLDEEVMLEEVMALSFDDADDDFSDESEGEDLEDETGDNVADNFVDELESEGSEESWLDNELDEDDPLDS